MSQDNQMDALAEFTALQADLEAARARATNLKAEWMKTAGSGELSGDAEQLKGELETALERVAELEVESKAKSERMGFWRREANFSRKELNIKQDWMTILTEEEYRHKLAEVNGAVSGAGDKDTGVRKRGALQINPNFDPKKHLTEAEQKIRVKIYEYLDSMKRKY